MPSLFSQLASHGVPAESAGAGRDDDGSTESYEVRRSRNVLLVGVAERFAEIAARKPHSAEVAQGHKGEDGRQALPTEHATTWREPLYGVE